ncbi:hypothetical protein K227x_23500 [Rubripirellula lacrimiformis]|uniref:Uncharacterized protein n=1 Tax=Rubripirellula lacrimiformis TaxID=1930273 RepID=A0A517NA01_9BACT|nr:hypothetical protein [Rubripirellula lacrimiformis]QDT03964.1 hypothetical protein K227x_23500 [Rubripirellula lacrimiformis]
MPLLLTAHPDNQPDRRLLLRVGQEARVGSSEWVELSIAGDDAIASEHFVVRCGSDATVEVLDDQHTLLVNGDNIDQLTLTDRSDQTTEFFAGRTAFSLSWFPDLVESVPKPADRDVDLTPDIVDERCQILDVAKSMKLSEAAIGLVNSPERVTLFLQRLIEAELHDDAVRFIAGTLPATDAVHWAMHASGVNAAAEPSVIDAVTAWTASAAEIDRCVVRDQLSACRPCHVAKWIAKAVVFSGGSIAPEGQPIIVPPKHLCGIAILTAHRWALAAATDRTAAINQWLDLGTSAIQRLHTDETAPTIPGDR